MPKNDSSKKPTSASEELGDARQVRFQKSVEAEIDTIASREGTDFPTITRMAVRRGLEQLKKDLGGEKKAA